MNQSHGRWPETCHCGLAGSVIGKANSANFVTLGPSGENEAAALAREMLETAISLAVDASGIVSKEMSWEEEVRVKSSSVLEEECLKILARNGPRINHYAALVLRPDFDVNKQRQIWLGPISEEELFSDDDHFKGFPEVLMANSRKLQHIYQTQKSLFTLGWDIQDPGEFVPAKPLFYDSLKKEDGQSVFDDLDVEVYSVTSTLHCGIDEDDKKSIISLTKDLGEGGFNPEEWCSTSKVKADIDKLPVSIFYFQNPNCKSFQTGRILLKSVNVQHYYGLDSNDIGYGFEGVMRARALARSIESITAKDILSFVIGGGSPGD